MKYKMIMLASILLLAILTLGAVSASDGVDNLTASDDAVASSVDDAIVTDEDDDSADDWTDDDPDDGGDESEGYYEVNLPDELIKGDEDSEFEYWFLEDVTGNVTIFIDDNMVYATEVNSEWGYVYFSELGINELDYGTHSMDFVYSGDDTYENFTISGNFDLTYRFYVYRESYDLASRSVAPYGEDIFYYVRLPGSDGNLSYTINGKKYTISADEIYNSDGEEGFTIDADKLKFGRNKITFEYINDEYPQKTISDTFYVKGVVYSIEDIYYDGVAYVSTVLPADANGKLDIYEVITTYDDDIVTELVLIESVGFENGVANASLSNLTMGYHNIYVNYTGSDYGIYINSYDNDITDYYNFGFNVNPKVTYPHYVWVYGNYSATYQIPEKYNGILRVQIGEEEQTFAVENGIANFSLFNLGTDEYDWTDPETGTITLNMYLTFEDDENSFSDMIYLGVRERSPHLNLNLSETTHQTLVKDYDLYYNSVDVPYSADGNISIYVDDVLQDVVGIDYWDWYVSFEVNPSGLEIGEHDIRFEYYGNEYFLPETFYDSFTITYIRFDIPEDLVIGQYSQRDYENLANVYLPVDATGEVKLIIDGVDVETQEVFEGEASFDLQNLAHGTHTVTLVYQNGNYPQAEKSGKVDAKYSYEIVSDEQSYNYVYGSEEFIELEFPIGSTGHVKLNVEGKRYTFAIDDEGLVRFRLPGFAAGEYTATITYEGDDIHPEFSYQTTIEVYYDIESNYVYDIFANDLSNYYASLKLPKNATGSLVIYKVEYDSEDEEVLTEFARAELIDGEANITFDKLTPYLESNDFSCEIVACYVGSDYYVSREWYDFSVKSHNVIGPENPGKIQFNTPVEYTIMLPENVEGYLKVYKTYYDEAGDNVRELYYDNISLVNGEASVSFDNLNLGSHSFIFKYVGDDYEFIYSESLYVWPEDLTVNDEGSGDDVVVIVKMPSDSKGNLTLTIYNKVHEVIFNETYYDFTVPYSNGEAIVRASDLNVGNYGLYTFAIEDEKYGTFDYSRTSSFIWGEGSWIGKFKVNDFRDPNAKKDPNLKITADDIAKGGDLIVNIEVSSDVSRRVNVTVNGESKLVSLKNGTGSAKFSGLDVGTYDVTVSYGGDANYLKASASAKVKVTKPVAEIILAADEIAAGDVLTVNVQMPSDVSRRVNVTVNGESKLVSLKNGTGSAKFSGLAAGTYLISAAYSGDDVYLKSSASLKVKVNKAAADIQLTSEGIAVGDILVVNVQMPSDVTRRVTVTVNGEDKLVSLKNGMGSAKFKGLDVGTYVVTASYGGDANYAKASASIKAKVTNPKADINITANAISVGETLVVEIQLPSDVTRRASVIVGNVTKLVTLKQGKGTAKFTGLTVGTHTIEVLYGGDSSYSKSSASAKVKVNRGPANIKVTANAVAYGNDLEVNVQLPSDVTRRVSVTIGNETKTISLKEGKGTAKFSGLAVGTYTITTSYGGDAIYLKSSINTTAKVTKATPEIQVTTNDITAGEALTVSVKMPSDVAKRATVKINGSAKYVSLKQGTGSIKITGLSAGTHSVEVSYVGDANYKKATVSTSVEVKS